MEKKKLNLLIIGLIALSFVGVWKYVRAAQVASATNVTYLQLDGNAIYDSNGTQRLSIGSSNVLTGQFVTSGPVIQGDTATGASVTLPTTTTGSNFSNWVPVYNVGAAVVQGEILISSNTGTAYVRGGPATTDLTNVVGVAAAAIASGAKGWMVPRGGGYAVVLASGTVNIGDILVSSATWAGYGAADNTPTAGASYATAMSGNTTGSGSGILAILH